MSVEHKKETERARELTPTELMNLSLYIQREFAKFLQKARQRFHKKSCFCDQFSLEDIEAKYYIYWAHIARPYEYDSKKMGKIQCFRGIFGLTYVIFFIIINYCVILGIYKKK